MAVCAGIAVFATIWRAYVGSEDFIIKDVKGHATLGTALAFLNVFRSNLSYGRYWDGRGQLGTLVKSGRELMRLVVTYSKVPEDPDEEAKMEECLRDIWRLINCLMHSIVLAVQNFSGHFQIPAYDIDVELCNPGWLKPQEKAAIEKAEGISAKPDNKGRPALIAALLSHKIYYMYHMGWMNAAVLKKCDKCINDFVGAWMACEKIVGVPMVFPYTQMLSVFMVLFVYTFPFPLAHIFFNEDAEFNGFFITPFICALVAFAFFGMNAVGVEIENPFGDDDNDLPIKKMMKRTSWIPARCLS
jgi:putative membrane protein